MLINDRHGDSIARHHEAIEINSMRLAIKLLMALIRLLANLRVQQQQIQSSNKQVKVAEPVEMTAKLDGQTVIKATVEPDLLPGTDPALLTGSNPEELVSQTLSPFPNLPLLEAVEYIDAGAIERHADFLIEIAKLPPGKVYEEPGIKTFEVIDGDGQYLLNYKDGKVEENALANSINSAELSLKKVENLPGKKSQELSPQPIKPIEDERLAKLANLIVRFRDREKGQVADGRYYRIERKEEKITIFAQDGRGEIFSSSKDGYKNKLYQFPKVRLQIVPQE